MSRGTIVLVPGFLGCSILSTGLLYTDNEVWLNTPKLASYGLEHITLPLPDRPGIPPSNVTTRAGFPLEGVYRPFIQFMQLRDWEVLPVSQDWRRPADGLAEELFDFVMRRQEQWPLHFVAHSRGALIVRRLLGLLTDNVRPQAVGRVISVGCPHYGSISAVATLGDASPFVRAMRNATRIARGLYAFVRSGTAVDDAIRSWPALYELLPDPVRSSFSADTIEAIYDPESYADGGIPVYAPHLQDARDQWPAVPKVPEDVDWIDVAGYGVPTLYGLALPLDLTHRRGYFQSNSSSPREDGDGTVVVEVAEATGRLTIEVPCVHDALLRDGRLLPLIHSALVQMPKLHQRIEGQVAS